MCKTALSERKAVAMPVTALVQPGPAVVTTQPSLPVCRVRGHLFMANVDDANALIDAAVVDVDDVAAAQGEYRVHTLIFQCLGNQVPAGYHARVATLALQSIFGGRGLGLNRRGICGCHVASI